MLNSYPQELSTTGQNLWTTRQTRSSYPQLASNLTPTLRSNCLKQAAEAGSLLKRVELLGQSIALTALLLVTGITTANAYDPNVESYKLYAHMKLLDDKQYRCLVILWRMESQWNPKAKNSKSSAFGIPQLLKMTETNPYKQIDLGLKYITHHRIYKGDVCKALAHHKKVGHY
jgi:hypothetical protein